MASKLLAATRATGSTVYAMVIRLSDGYFLNDADGSFAAAPADPYLSLSEHAMAKGYYTVSEARIAWSDGLYRVLYYAQTGGAPAPVADTLFGAQEVYAFGDALVTYYDLALNARYLVVLLNAIKGQGKDLAAAVAAVAGQFDPLTSDINDINRNITRS